MAAEIPTITCPTCDGKRWVFKTDGDECHGDYCEMCGGRGNVPGITMKLCPDMLDEEACRNMLRIIAEFCRKACDEVSEPYRKRLVEIESRKPPAPMIVTKHNFDIPAAVVEMLKPRMSDYPDPADWGDREALDSSLNRDALARLEAGELDDVMQRSLAYQGAKGVKPR